MIHQQITLPNYSRGEEIINTISHLFGILIGLFSLILSPIFAHRQFGLLSGIIFGISLIVLYSISSLYHGISLKRIKTKKVFRVIDHCSIFILIAGSYTPLLLCLLRQYNPILGWLFFIFIWGIAILGIVLNIIDLKKFKLFSMVSYLLMGWSIVVRADILIKLMSRQGIILLISGGLAYSIGAIFYKLGKKYKWMHSIFHVFCLIGSVLHIVCIIKFVI